MPLHLAAKSEDISGLQKLPTELLARMLAQVTAAENASENALHRLSALHRVSRDLNLAASEPLVWRGDNTDLCSTTAHCTTGRIVVLNRIMLGRLAKLWSEGFKATLARQWSLAARVDLPGYPDERARIWRELYDAWALMERPTPHQTPPRLHVADGYRWLPLFNMGPVEVKKGEIIRLRMFEPRYCMMCVA